MYDPKMQLESEVFDDEPEPDYVLAGLQWTGGVMAVVGLACALIALWGA